MTNEIVKCFSGCFYAISDQRAVHYGRIGKQFPIHDRWSWIYNYGSNACTGKAKAKSHSIDFDGIHFYFGLIFHNMDFHAHETAWIFATIRKLHSNMKK